jgi:hypothetical protein
MLNLFKKNDSPYYNNNEQLRACNVNIQYTAEQIEEIRRCKKDPIYFIETYVKIITVDGIKPFILHDFQKRFVHSFVDNRFTLGKIFRQAGKTQVTVGYLLWYTLFSDQPVRCAVLANDRSQSEEILSRYKFSYELLPFWMQQGIKSWNVRTVELENKSKIITGATTKSGIRGRSINLIILDEVAFIPSTVFGAFMSSIAPAISSGKDTKLIAISTPQGMNHFYEMWEDAINGRNDYKTIEAHWSEVRTQQWADDMLKLLNNDKVKFAQEIECVTGDTLVTVRNKITGEITQITMEELNSSM